MQRPEMVVSEGSLMSKRNLLVIAALCLVVTPLSDRAAAQSSRDLVGAWTAVSNTAEQGGVKSEPYGPTPQGTLIFEAGGRYGLILSKNDVPKIASNQSHQCDPRREQGGGAGNDRSFRHLFGQ